MRKPWIYRNPEPTRLHPDDLRAIMAAIITSCPDVLTDAGLKAADAILKKTHPPEPVGHEPGDFSTVPFDTYQRDIDAMRRLVFNAEEAASKAQAQAVEAHNGWNKANMEVEGLKADRAILEASVGTLKEKNKMLEAVVNRLETLFPQLVMRLINFSENSK